MAFPGWGGSGTRFLSIPPVYIQHQPPGFPTLPTRPFRSTIARSFWKPFTWADEPRLHMVVARGAAAANSRAIRAMSAAGTVLSSSAHSGVQSFRTFSHTSSRLRFAQVSNHSRSASPSLTITCPMARAMAPSVPGLGMKNSSEVPAVFDMRTSKVTSLAPLTNRPRWIRWAPATWPWCASNMFEPKFRMYFERS